MKTTLQDIADQTGLSISTVSRVLRGESKTNSKNVELVIDAAQSLNYKINTRVLYSVYKYRKNFHVALISSIHEGEFYASLFFGLDEASKDTNVVLGHYNIEEKADQVLELIRSLGSDNLDAAILFLPSLKEHDYYNIMDNAPEDFIMISAASVFHPALDTVTFDSYRGGYLTGKHFEDKGYNEVGIITGPLHRHESLLRKAGFTDYIAHHSDINLIWQYEGDYSYESGQEAYAAFKALDHKPKAIFSSNDYMCFAFMEEAMKEGLQVPGDIALSGYDNLPLTKYLSPTITSIDTNFCELGKSIFNMIEEKIEKRNSHKGISRVVPVSLIEREST